MNPELRSVASHMKNLGLGSLSQALYNSLFFNPDNLWTSALAILNTAHAAELLIKARIAEEHPLLIFSEIPKLKHSQNGLLSFDDLFQKGKTLQFSELPDRLWAVTGVELQNVKCFEDFGRLRNSVQHFAAPKKVDVSQRCLEFVFNVLDPFMHETWKLYAVDYNQDPDHYEFVIDTFTKRNIRPLISPRAARVWSKPRFRPGDDAPTGYAEWFDEAIASALISQS